MAGFGKWIAAAWCVWCVPAWGAAQEEGNAWADSTDFLTAGLVVTTPGRPVYSSVGHASLRMRCPAYGLDYVFSPEITEPMAAIWGFLSGTARAGVVMVKTGDYLEMCRADHRGMTEYRLNLTLEEKRRLWKLLDEKVAEGLYMSFDYLNRGCSIEVISFVEGVLEDGEIVYGRVPARLSGSRREIIYGVLDDSPWNRLALMLLMGREGDAEVALGEKLILPADVALVWRDAEVADTAGHRRPLLKGNPVVLYEAGTKVSRPQVALHPLAIASALFLWTILLTGVQLRRPDGFRLCGRATDVFLFVSQSIAGAFMCYLWWFSDLAATGWNKYVIPFNVLPAAVRAVETVRPFGTALRRRIYGTYALVLAGFTAVCAFLPCPDYPLWFLFGAMAIRLCYHAFLSERSINEIKTSQTQKKTSQTQKKSIMRKFTIKRACKRLCAFAASTFVFANSFAGEMMYHYFWAKMETLPTGKGLIYCDTLDTQEPENYLERQDYKFMRQVLDQQPTTTFTAWVKPADGYLFAGWSADGETLVSYDGSLKQWLSLLSKTPGQENGLDVPSFYPLEPDSVYYAMFAKVVTRYVPGEEALGTVENSKLLNDTGDKVTLTAKPSAPYNRFAFWKNGKGEQFKDNPLTLTVSEADNITVYFDSDSTRRFSFPEDGGYVLFSSSHAAYLAGDMEGCVVTPDSVTDGDVRLTRYGFSVNANEGYLLYGKGECTITFYDDPYEWFDEENILMSSGESGKTIDGSEADKKYYLFRDGVFVLAKEGDFVEPNSAYLAIPDSCGVTAETLTIDGGSLDTGIRGTEAARPAQLHASGTYDLAGRRTATPDKNGIYIVDGKKVLYRKR